MLRARAWSDHQARAGFVLSLILTFAIGAPTARGSDPLGKKELAAARNKQGPPISIFSMSAFVSDPVMNSLGPRFP